MIPFNTWHEKFLKSLQKHKVKFIIIGGQAAIFHGVRRNTGDLDVLIEPGPASAARFIKALEHMEMDTSELQPYQFVKDCAVTFGNEPEAVDVVNNVPGIEFNSAYRNAWTVNAAGLKLKVMDINDLLKSKEALNRKGRKAYLVKFDIASLKEVLKGNKKK